MLALSIVNAFCQLLMVTAIGYLVIVYLGRR